MELAEFIDKAQDELDAFMKRDFDKAKNADVSVCKFLLYRVNLLFRVKEDLAMLKTVAS